MLDGIDENQYAERTTMPPELQPIFHHRPLPRDRFFMGSETRLLT